VQSTQTRGFITGTKTKILGTASDYLYTVNIYDERGRLIQVFSQNVTGPAATDITTTQYTWDGRPLVIVQQQQAAGTPGQTTVTVTQTTYDTQGRVIKTEKKLSNTQVNGNTMSDLTTVTTVEYDELGQLRKKKLGSKKDPATGTYYSPRQPLEEMAYDYNIRGWLLGINKDYITGTSNSDRYFGCELGYDQDPSIGS